MTPTAEPSLTDYRVFPSPSDIMAAVRLPAAAAAFVARSRDEVRAVLNGTNDRLIVITGPCSVHDPQAALEYATRLSALGLADELLIIMRAYPEKPRTVTGWTGLVNDPGLDGSHDVRRGLREARQLLVSLATLRVPAACEWVNPAIPSFLADAVTWSAIGARTTESQVHRQLASSLPTPVGFKNATDGWHHRYGRQSGQPGLPRGLAGRPLRHQLRPAERGPDAEGNRRGWSAAPGRH